MTQFGFSRKIPTTGILLTLLFIAMVAFVYDLLFSVPTIHKGVIVEKIFVPSKNASGPNALNYGSRYKTYKYNITVKNDHQWIALVKSDDGDTLKVTCKSDHYTNKDVGDTLLFKEFRGKFFKVEYLSHNDEDIDSLDLKSNRVR
jgi:hypothetical protein